MWLTTLFKTFFYLFLLVIIGAFVAFVFFGLENNARIKSQKELSVQKVKRAKLFMDRHDPRKLTAGQKQSLSVGEKDLNLVFHYALSRIPGGKKIGIRVDMEPGTAAFAGTFKLPKNPFRSYFNLSIILSQAPGKPIIKTVEIGRIVLTGPPAHILMPVTLFVLSRFDASPELVEVTDTIKAYQFRKDQLFLVYEWQPEVAEKLTNKGRKMLISKEDRERFLVYNEHLAVFSRTVNEKKPSLSKFMKPVFTLAKERSAATNEPVLESRAAIVVLAVFALKKSIKMLVGEEEGNQILKPKQFKTTLRGRHDLAKHFMLSAAIAATADIGLANAIGLFKELDDSRGGSGFSFSDLAADRAGVRFAELGTGTSGQAEHLQDQMSRISGESDFMPRIDRLPDGMQEMEFKRRYEDLDSAAYGKVKDEIERRIKACKVFR